MFDRFFQKKSEVFLFFRQHILIILKTSILPNLGFLGLSVLELC